MLDKEQILWFCKEKESPKHKKERLKPPLRGRRGAYLPFLFVVLASGAGVSSSFSDGS